MSHGSRHSGAYTQKQKEPSEPGTKEGEVRRGRNTINDYVWRINEDGRGSWRKITLTPEEAKARREVNRINFTLTSFAPPTTNYSSAALRYPDDGSGNAGMTEQSDYVLFQFYEYKPPFNKNAIGEGSATGSNAGTQFARDYNLSLIHI